MKIYTLDTHITYLGTCKVETPRDIITWVVVLHGQRGELPLEQRGELPLEQRGELPLEHSHFHMVCLCFSLIKKQYSSSDAVAETRTILTFLFAICFDLVFFYAKERQSS
jgi:hypothetical protein